MHNNDPNAEPTEFKDRRILVTGGTRGIGEAIVDRLIRGGGDVIATARSVSLETSADRFVQGDVSTREGIETVVKVVTDRFKGLDILIHNVGGSAARGGGALALSDDDWQRAFDTNLFGAVRSRSRVSAIDAGVGLRRDHPHLFNSTNASAFRRYACLRSSRFVSSIPSLGGLAAALIYPRT